MLFESLAGSLAVLRSLLSALLVSLLAALLSALLFVSNRSQIVIKLLQIWPRSPSIVGSE